MQWQSASDPRVKAVIFSNDNGGYVIGVFIGSTESGSATTTHPSTFLRTWGFGAVTIAAETHVELPWGYAVASIVMPPMGHPGRLFWVAVTPVK
jgi:hypothetical protein